MDLNKTVFITFDIDWACDEVIRESLHLVESEGIRSTFFLTHVTEVFEGYENSDQIELGAHPNFNNLLNGPPITSGGVQQIVKDIKEVVPSAVSVRSHSLTQNTRLLDLFMSHGFTHDVNLLIPAQSGIELAPFRNWGGLIRVPYFWEEDVHCLFLEEGREHGWDPSRFLDSPGLKIFNFHPIHVFLNTEHLSRYDRSRALLKNPDALVAYKNPDPVKGTCHFLKALIAEAKKRNMDFGLIREITV